MGLFDFQKKKKKENPVVLAESWSPICNIQAFVEDNGDAVYFYLWVNPSTEYAEVRNVWVCNRKTAPDTIDTTAMEEGIAPMMPGEFVGHPRGGISLNSGQLSIQWFAEGDGAALLSEGEILAVIPSWSGNGFHGYAKYCTGNGPFAWAMEPALESLRERIRYGQRCWDNLEGGYWEPLREQLLEAYQSDFGPYKKYFAIDGGAFPPKALVTMGRDNISVGMTAGVSALVMPGVEATHQENASRYHRMELAFGWEDGTLSEEAYMGMLSYVSGQSGLPWSSLTWLGHGHTIPCDSLDGFSAVLLLSAEDTPELLSPKCGLFMEEPIQLLWMVPLTEEEYALAQQVELVELLRLTGGDKSRLHIFDGTPKFRTDIVK